MSITIEIEGIEELQRRLKALEIKPSEVRNVMLEGATIIRDEAQRRAPYDPKRKRGIHLRDAIFASAKPRFPDDMSAIAAVSHKRAPHSHLVEFGARGGNMPAIPFFRPAIDTTKGLVGKIIELGLEDLIEKAASS